MRIQVINKLIPQINKNNLFSTIDWWRFFFRNPSRNTFTKRSCYDEFLLFFYLSVLQERHVPTDSG